MGSPYEKHMMNEINVAILVKMLENGFAPQFDVLLKVCYKVVGLCGAWSSTHALAATAVLQTKAQCVHHGKRVGRNRFARHVTEIGASLAPASFNAPLSSLRHEGEMFRIQLVNECDSSLSFLNDH